MENSAVNDIITTHEAAAILQFTEPTVRKMLNAGTLPGTRLGKKAWRMRRSALYKLIPAEVAFGNG